MAARLARSKLTLRPQRFSHQRHKCYGGTSYPHDYDADHALISAVSDQETQYYEYRRDLLHRVDDSLGLVRQIDEEREGLRRTATRGALAHEVRRFFRIAISEASEAGGAIDLALDFGALSKNEHAELRALLVRRCATLNGLSHR